MCRRIRDIQIYVMHRIMFVVFPNAVQRSTVTSAQNDIILVPRGDAPRRKLKDLSDAPGHVFFRESYAAQSLVLKST